MSTVAISVPSFTIFTLFALSPFIRISIVENVVVDSGNRSAGVGKRLVEAAVKIARREKSYRLSLTTNRKRKAAHRFYERLGWRRTHFCFTLPLTPELAGRPRN